MTEAQARSCAIPVEQLNRRCRAEEFPFRTTDELAQPEATLGQGRALTALALGVEITAAGHNVFVMGTPGAGRHAAVRRYLETIAAARPSQDDWCYLNRFDNPRHPKALRLPAGRGSLLKSDMMELVRDLRAGLPEALESEALAVTGSINQHGVVQVIGCINEKIEGFFAACRERGLTGTQGVILPADNVPHLTLNDEVIAAVDRGRFQLYAVRTLDEAIALLSGMETGERGVSGEYPSGTFNGLVDDRLREFARHRQEFAREAFVSPGGASK